MLEQLGIIRVGGPESFYQPANRDAFGKTVTSLFEIEVVHYVSQARDTRVADPESSYQPFERAVAAVMAEFDVGHVKGNLALGHARLWRGERKPRVRRNEPAYEPGGGHAIDPGTGARDPDAAPKVFAMEGAFLGTACAVWGRQEHLEILDRLTSVVRRRRIEVIDGRNCREPLLKFPQLRVWRRAPRRAAARSPLHTPNIPGKTMVVSVPVALKLTNELVIGVAIDRICF